jgi:hypothetical protein
MAWLSVLALRAPVMRRGGYSPAPPPFREVPRAAPLNVADDATFEGWLAEDSMRTLDEYAAAEWTNRPLGPAPPPPSTASWGAVTIVANRAKADAMRKKMQVEREPQREPTVAEFHNTMRRLPDDAELMRGRPEGTI